MPRILMVANKRETLEALAHALEIESTAEIDWVDSPSKALEYVAAQKPDLVVVDEDIDDLSNFEFIRQLLQINAFVHTAAVSRLPPESFHDVAEGLGILAQLPPNPGVVEAKQLLSLLEDIGTAPRP